MTEENLTHFVGITAGVFGVVSFISIFTSSSVPAIVMFGIAAFLFLTVFRNYMHMWSSRLPRKTIPLRIPLPGDEEIIIQDVDDPNEVRAALEMLDNDMLKVLVKSLGHLVQEDPTFRCGVVNEILIEVVADRGEEFFDEG